MATFSLDASILTCISVFKVIKNRGTPSSLYPTLKFMNTIPVWSGRCGLPLICRQNSVLTLKRRVYTER